MEKKTILAVVLSSAILILYYGFFYKPVKPPVAPTPVASTATAPQSPGALPAPGLVAAPPESAPSAAPLQKNELENSLVKAELTSRAGLVDHWWLKKFFEKADDQGGHTQLLLGDEQNPGMGLFLFPGQAPVSPFYQIKPESDQDLIYQTQWKDLALEQKIEFGKKDYALEVYLKIKNLGSAPQTLAPGLRLATQQTTSLQKKHSRFLGQQPNHTHPLFNMAGKVQREAKLDGMGPYTEKVGEVNWVGLEDRYFLRAVLARRLSAQNKFAYGVQGDRVFSDFQYAPESIAPGEEKEYAFTLYLGPKDPTYLNAFSDVGLEQAIDYGWFAFAARPILYSLKFFHSFLKNWGLAIIALTVVIKLLLYPLTRKSMQSMKVMQQLQPQLQKLREKYKDDRERLNVETMNLFKANKANPMGGCLPMILQMPIYIALYKVLYNATELYHAPFFWFYRDLSASDPYFVLPILLGIFMVLQQKMTPTAGDPAQAKMLMFMPILFTVFMLFLPVGLVLYIFVNTVMTVVQQYMHQKDIRMVDLFSRKKAAV